ncbi:hypothetical protein DKX38_005893 [Salix brachista]|uniref:Uncharacterized protein n=1 Tax=Salix brachista TaxID=2182728 RepID=A0A5N5N3X7_9ROSI|nr:hypothetical protein DKX38_005893 [Salix brachista]
MGSAALRSSLLPSFPQKSRFGDGKRPSGTVVVASRRENSREWMMGVDESMVVLRKRIHEMKMVERNYEPPEEWMEWEKQCYTSYDEFILSMFMIARQLVEATFGVFSTVHGATTPWTLRPSDFRQPQVWWRSGVVLAAELKALAPLQQDEFRAPPPLA